MIICAAIRVYHRDENGDVDKAYVIPCYRHHNGLKLLFDLNPELIKEARLKKDVEQGFMNHTGNFVDRKTALTEFIACGQSSASLRDYMNQNHQKELFSEDLY